ncbi:MAG: c-type cytochrome [Anaerolineales bacterium]|nr:c-type cytochrome [Anaerolineales bacterium]
MENIARIAVLIVVFGASLVVVATLWVHNDGVMEIHAAMPEKGGWLPDNITAQVNEPLNLRLVSDDVVHSFALGQSDMIPVDVLPGIPTEITINIDQPGTYTFYCTRWCGANHWRMRGTITVEGVTPIPIEDESSSPLYLDLGIDLDAPHDLPDFNLKKLPSAERGSDLRIDLPAQYYTREYYQSHSPYQVWEDLHAEPFSLDLDDAQLWDLVAALWSDFVSPQTIKEGQEIYAQNCAACHGSAGGGDGVFAPQPYATPQFDSMGNEVVPPLDFSDPGQMYGASPALLQGKILRGGMGTGMPSWGKIFTDTQSWALADYLWTFSIQDLEE